MFFRRNKSDIHPDVAATRRQIARAVRADTYRMGNAGISGTGFAEADASSAMARVAIRGGLDRQNYLTGNGPDRPANAPAAIHPRITR